MLRLENMMCCVLFKLRRVLNAVVLRLEIENCDAGSVEQGRDAFGDDQLRFVLCIGPPALVRPLMRLHSAVMHDNTSISIYAKVHNKEATRGSTQIARFGLKPATGEILRRCAPLDDGEAQGSAGERQSPNREAGDDACC
jgi:hypothetical protein